MARWAPTLGKKTPQPEVEGAKSLYGGSGMVRRPQVAYNSDWNIARSVEDGLQKVTWVFRCVDAIASNAARINLQVRDGDPYEGAVVTGLPVLAKLNSKSNPGESAFNFRYRLSAQVLLSKKGAFVEIVRTRGGDVERLNLLHPDLVKPIKHRTDFVSGYEVQIPADHSNGMYRNEVRKLKPEDVIWIKRPNPFDPYTAMTPVESCGLAIETDYLAKMYNRNFLINDGRPGGMVIVKGDMTEEDKEELRARFRGNVMSAGRISVIASDGGADFVDTAVNPRDAQYVESRAITKEEIQIAFGVPQSVLGNAADRTFDNAEMERLIFWMETMLPHVDLLLRPMDVLVEEDGNYFLSPDLSRVDVLQRMEVKRREFLLRELDGGAISVDEYRSATGRDVVGNIWGRTLFSTTRKVPYTTTDGEDVEQLGPKPQADTGRPPDDTVQEEPEEEPREREDERLPGGVTPNKSKSEAPSTDDVVEAINDSKRWITITEATLERFATRQKTVILEKMNGAKSRKLIERKAPVEDILGMSFNDSVWDRQIEEDIAPIVKGIFREAQVEDDGSDVIEQLTAEMVKEFSRVNFFLKSRIASHISKCASVDNDELRIMDTIKGTAEILDDRSMELLAMKLVAKARFETALLKAREIGADVVYEAQLDESSVVKRKALPNEPINTDAAYFAMHVE